MIELRIVRKKVPRPREIDDGFYSPSLPDHIFVDELQFRTWQEEIRMLHQDGGTTYTPAQWSDWQSVPIVDESGEKL